MTIPKNHHYVPQSYQRHFKHPQSGELFFYDKQSGVTRPLNPKNLLAENHLYKLEQVDENHSAQHIETEILSPLDGRYNQVIQALSSPAPVLDKPVLSEYLAYLRLRGPEMISGAKELLEESSAAQLYAHICSDPAKRQGAREVRLELESFEAFNKSLNPITISVERDVALAMLPVSADLCAKEFNNLRWTIIRSSHGTFISSDTPVCCVGEENSDEPVNYIIPLSSTMVLHIDRQQGDDAIAWASEEKVAEINHIVAYCAKRWLIGATEEAFIEAITAR